MANKFQAKLTNLILVGPLRTNKRSRGKEKALLILVEKAEAEKVTRHPLAPKATVPTALLALLVVWGIFLNPPPLQCQIWNRGHLCVTALLTKRN